LVVNLIRSLCDSLVLKYVLSPDHLRISYVQKTDNAKQLYIMDIRNTVSPPPQHSECYQANFAAIPFGHRRTQYFLVSSRSKSPHPNPSGINQYSTTTSLVWNIFWKNGMNINNTNTERVNPIAMKMYKFLVVLGPMGGCCRIDNRRVRVMRRFPHCIKTNVTKYTDCA